MAAIVTLTVLAFIATVVVLFTGVGSMAQGGKFDRAHDTQLMVARVTLQGIAVVLVLLAVYIANT